MKGILLLLTASIGQAEDLGTFGTTFPIKEENPVEVIQRKLNDLSEMGQLEQHQKAIQKQMIERALNPEPVKGIVRAKANKTRFYDPSIKAPYDLKDNEGKVFHQAGTTVNPLKIRPLTKPLVFFNGEDPEQVAWALSQYQKNNRSKLILIQGSPFKLTETHEIPFYYDQLGKITEKLGITEVPALVIQKDDQLQIDTIALEEEGNHDK